MMEAPDPEQKRDCVARYGKSCGAVNEEFLQGTRAFYKLRMA
jgi:hypothetical protein